MSESLQVQKPLPHSEESERAILAGVMLDSALLASVSSRLTPEDFYSDPHKVLYQALLDLQEAGSDVDLRTVQARLEQQDHLARVGGLAYITQLDLDLPDLSRLDTYVEIVKERSVRRRLIGTCARITRDCFDGGLEAQEALGKAEQEIFGLGEEAIQRGFVSLASILKETVAELEERPDKGALGLPTGFVDLDRMTRGLHPANLVIVAGRPGMGKTSLALNIAQNVAFREDRVVGLFSLEMSQQELALRLMSSESGVTFKTLRSGHMSRRQWSDVIGSVKKISAGNLYIDDSANPSLLEVASKARRLKAEKNLSLLIIDYLQLMQAGGRYESRNLEIAAITRSLKQLSKELDLPVIALSQLSRQPERRSGDHRPQLADLRESGSIEQDADLVIFVYRDELYDTEDPEKKGQAELIVAKHRNGETGRVELVFLGETTSFKSRSRQEPSEAHF
jgi:replicative DNA helicase